MREVVTDRHREEGMPGPSMVVHDRQSSAAGLRGQWQGVLCHAASGPQCTQTQSFECHDMRCPLQALHQQLLTELKVGSRARSQAGCTCRKGKDAADVRGMSHH